jgi:tagatose-6-phosphate ketose/aldose isomerase
MATLGLSDAYLKEHGAACTAREIARQPQAWRETQSLLERERERIHAFLAPLMGRTDLRIILTGAGSSAYIGQCLAPELLRSLGRRIEAIATTDLVSGPRDYLQRAVPTLLVSFARSGASPESLAATELADACLDQCHHLIITCNPQGALALKSQSQPRRLTMVLPPSTHDEGFAMTASFSSMIHAARAMLMGIDGHGAWLARVARAAERLIRQHNDALRELAQQPLERVVFLGSRAMAGLAAESALKLLELSDGAVVTAANTPLGFRHGPKTIVNRATLVVVYLSNDPLSRKYETDLVRELHGDGIAGALLAVTAQPPEREEPYRSLLVPDVAEAGDGELLLPYVIVAQLYALHRSLHLGNTPDTPCASGRVNRIVKGVTIYPL